MQAKKGPWTSVRLGHSDESLKWVQKGTMSDPTCTQLLSKKIMALILGTQKVQKYLITWAVKASVHVSHVLVCRKFIIIQSCHLVIVSILTNMQIFLEGAWMHRFDWSFAYNLAYHFLFTVAHYLELIQFGKQHCNYVIFNPNLQSMQNSPDSPDMSGKFRKMSGEGIWSCLTKCPVSTNQGQCPANRCPATSFIFARHFTVKCKAIIQNQIQINFAYSGLTLINTCKYMTNMT